MNYSYICETCDVEAISTEFRRIGEHLTSCCPLCDGRLTRMASSPSIIAGWQAGFNPTVGGVMQSKSAFKSELERKSDEMSERTGASHHFVPIDTRDPQAVGVTEEGLDATRKRMRDSGQTAATARIIV